jgi:TPR repeat protein
MKGALKLIAKAAAGKHSDAMVALGALLGGGHQIEADRKMAQRWFRKAAELGHGPAQMMLGRYLAAGAAGEIDPREARQWLERVVAQGITEAQTDLSALSNAPGELAFEASGGLGHGG